MAIIILDERPLFQFQIPITSEIKDRQTLPGMEYKKGLSCMKLAIPTYPKKQLEETIVPTMGANFHFLGEF